MSVDESAVQQLVAVGGFDAAVATDALQRFSGDVDEALLHLLGDGASSPPRRQPTISSDPDETDEAPLVVSPAEPEPEPEPEPETESQLETEPEPEPEPPQDDTLRQDSIQTVMDMIGGNKVFAITKLEAAGWDVGQAIDHHFAEALAEDNAAPRSEFEQLQNMGFENDAGDLEAALSQTGGNVAEAAGLLAEGFTASSSDTSKDTVQSGSATREKDDADSNDSKIEYLMQLHDGVDRSLAHAALDAVDGDLQLAAEDLLDGGHWVTNDVTDDDVTLLLDMGITTNLDLAKHALEKADRDVDQAAELILGGLLLPSNGRSSKHVEKRNAERITAAPRNQFHSTEGNPSSSSEDESEIDEAQKVTRRGKTLKKPASGKAGKPDCQSGDYENDEELRDDEPLDSSDEDGYLAEALQLSIEELVDGEIDMEEDAKTTREISLRWQELANVQVTLRMFGHELSSCELEKLQTEQDGLRDFLGLDPLPRRPQHQAKSTLPGESGKGHRPGEKGKKKDTGGSGNTRHSGSPEKRNELTEAEEQTMVQVVQSFELTIEEVFHVQTQRKQTTGNAFTDAAGLVDAVLSYMTTMEDAELARVLHADDVTPEQPQQQRRRRQDAGINDDSGESESSDEGGRIRNRQDRVKNKRDDQRYRLPGAAAFKEHGGGALLRSVEHEQFYETIEADDWQIAMKKKAVKHRKKLESMQHKSIKQNNERAAGLNQGRQQKRPSRRTKPEQHAAVFSESEWEADDWVSESGLLIPPPPSQPHHPSSTEAILLQKNAELQRQIAEMRRSQQQTLEQKMEALWQQAHQLPTSQSVAGASSWADMAKKDTMADPNLIFGGAGVPPRNIQEDVHWWPFLQRYIIESLITTGKTKWEEITPIVAKSLQGASSLQGLLPLERFLHERWSWLPPQPHRHKFVFTASVALLKNGKLKWELRWPELVSRRESLGKSGFTKRIYEYYGHENLLFVDIPSGVHGVEVAKRLRQCTPAGGWKIKMLGQRWSLLEVRPESGSKKPQMVLTCATDKLRNDAGVYDTWHFDPCANKEISIAKSLARSNMGMSSVITTVVLSSDRILPCQDGLGDFADGACGISESLFAMVWEQYCEQTFTEDAGVIPSTFQGRIGSKKGVWYIDDRIADGCVEFRSNQQKWYIPSPTDEQLTIEVCCFGENSGPARLNLQMIRLLELRMQSTTTNPRGPLLLADLLIDQLENDAKALTDFEACERFCRDGGDKGEAILEKLRSGWRLEDEIVQSLLRKSMVARHRKCVDENKLHIKLKKSRDYIIVPDPFGILEPHEVVVKVPGIGYLQEPCIIGRSPCYHPGELLTVEAVHIIDLISRCNQDGRNKNWKSTFEWFERQQCVVILSSKPVGQAFAGTHGHTQNWDPNRGVADLMQGGDYDGDNVKVIWDERFVVAFKPWEPIVYTPPQKHRLGSMKIGELPAGISVDDVAFEYFLEVVRDSEMSPVGLISTLHENWSLEAAGDWNSAAGENCESLADLAQKALDAVSTGYEIVVPQQLKNVERSSYRRRSSPDAGIVRASDDPDMFTVCVVGLEETVKADTLEEALKVAYNLGSVCEAWIPVSQNYGFIAFKSKAERDKVIGRSVLIHGKKAKIRPDTREHKRTTGVMDEIWAAYSRFARVSLAALDNEQVSIPRDPEVEADIVNSDPAAHEAVRKELHRVCNEMAKAYRDESTKDGSFHDRMDEIKHQVKLKLVARHGLQRDLWASAWYTEMRQRLNRELKAWDQSPTGRQIGVERPYPKLWLNEIFGKDWDQMKARRLPPQRSKQSKVKGARTRYRAGRRAN